MLGVLGEFNENLKELEKITKTNLYFRGNSILIKSDSKKNEIIKSIDSVLGQIYKHLELIVIDDGSTDGSFEFLQQRYQFDKRFKIFRQENKGVSSARNLGLQHAKGEWIAFLDADDIWHPRKLELQLKAVKESETQFCSARGVNFVDPIKVMNGKYIVTFFLFYFFMLIAAVYYRSVCSIYFFEAACKY